MKHALDSAAPFTLAKCRREGILADLPLHGNKLRAADMILTGACCGITKVAAGQMFAGCFADFPPLQIQFV
jgi:hypothetical protein